MRADNSIHLVTAARQRHEHTRAKAIAAMHELDRAGAALTFEAVAHHAGVSRSWIYTQTDLKDKIRRLRDQRRTKPSAPIPTRQRASDDSLRLRLESPTAATVNSPRRTSDYAVSSPAPSASAATTVYIGPPTSRKHIAVR
ncbi:MAG: transposase [Frankiales bacterium]|nr:transposase [Frankiales bacterium]